MDPASLITALVTAIVSFVKWAASVGGVRFGYNCNGTIRYGLSPQDAALVFNNLVAKKVPEPYANLLVLAANNALLCSVSPDDVNAGLLQPFIVNAQTLADNVKPSAVEFSLNTLLRAVPSCAPQAPVNVPVGLSMNDALVVYNDLVSRHIPPVYANGLVVTSSNSLLCGVSPDDINTGLLQPAILRYSNVPISAPRQFVTGQAPVKPMQSTSTPWGTLAIGAAAVGGAWWLWRGRNNRRAA